MDHFPTEAESHQLAQEFDANQPPLNPEAVTLRLDRFVEALSLSPLSDAVSDLTRPIPQLRLKPHSRFTDVIEPWLTDLIIAMGRRRIDHRARSTPPNVTSSIRHSRPPTPTAAIRLSPRFTRSPT
ncbi:MAG TPA: hypothetical protein VHT50_03645 [Mycobacterium sp.]|nr:hypothetical protein [Mycobacterium sp.]